MKSDVTPDSYKPDKSGPVPISAVTAFLGLLAPFDNQVKSNIIPPGAQ